MLLLSYSISWCQNDTIPSTGVVEQDSVVIPISAIKVANAKMIELKCQKEENENLRQIIKVDSVLIDALENNILACIYEKEQQEEYYENTIHKLKKQRNIAIGAGSCSTTLLIALLILLL